jgi:hypothetical protein
LPGAVGIRGRKGKPAHRDLPVRRAHRACKACLAPKGNKVLRGNRVPKGRKDRRVHPAPRAIPDRLPLR